MPRRRLIPLIATALAALALGASSAQAAAPVIIPVSPDPDPFAVPSTTTNDNGGVLWFPGPAWTVKGSVIHAGSWVYFAGDPYTKFPVVWEDVGSGQPVAGIQGSNGFNFPLAGEYPYHCGAITNVNNCFLDPRRSKIWVIGVRPILKPTLASPDNITTPVLYNFDASGSFVADFTAHNIVEYAYDFTSDGTWDQVSSDPYAQAALDPGDQVVSLRAKDDTGRTTTIAMAIQVPKARSAPPTPTQADTSLAGSNVISGEKFDKVNLKITAKKKMKVSALRRNGLIVKVSGVTKGDTVTAKVLNGKKVMASGKKKATSTKVTVRVKAGKKGRSLLKKLKKKTTRLVLSVTATAEDDAGSFNKRVALRVTR